MADQPSILISKLEELESARAKQREVDNEVKRLKVETAVLNARTAFESGQVSPSDLAQLVDRALDSW